MIIKKIIKMVISQLNSIFLVFMNSFSKRETKLYPEIPVKLTPRYRGRIVLTRNKNGKERCVACNLCSSVCPVGCISLQKKTLKNNRWKAKFFRINFSRCIFCGLCEEACPTSAIQLISDFELADYKRKDLIYEKEDLLISGPGKYSDYDFYKYSGITIKDPKNKSLLKKNKTVNLKSLLP
ncbi:MAG: NADH-quinone oxidoreductase subunit NuoI [Buchnera aphidicola (Periphyllus lyropictus)]|uniref:NADH-quinone oxidoreductase subunit NuoI n=1 Tax=Buchnera aphidicola TaxID=9 RepID=UPI001EB1FED0|nr:NADH-quinone oxidoreductase subunit NuoI [Buchnera aphidicola]NIH16684.1 NADH-quinone oxidoreductase subunit NuoI [Buchnera aphidicola (Periphyllus lyropictus)]USS94591.1 NADH-quinone oxidoreductase subunit NuoI [Buchnera aphidicola (Periphyllus lyropictus)]